LAGAYAMTVDTRAAMTAVSRATLPSGSDSANAVVRAAHRTAPEKERPASSAPSRMGVARAAAVSARPPVIASSPLGREGPLAGRNAALAIPASAKKLVVARSLRDLCLRDQSRHPTPAKPSDQECARQEGDCGAEA
jgi:hypothetical protein